MSNPITPETKIAELLDAYPQLEEVLVQQSPHFKALKNPILRRTVAKVATLEKASQMSGIPVRRLVAALREAVGLPGEPSAADVGPDVEPAVVDGVAPAWFDEAKVEATIDADELLAKGEVPLPRVHQAVQGLPAGSLLRVKSAFRPAPLLEALHKAGHRTYVTKASPDAFHTYVCPKASA
jgi:Domain of unknown function (DUF1858)/Uncharacterized conserved protein (DUF2249)